MLNRHTPVVTRLFIIILSLCVCAHNTIMSDSGTRSVTPAAKRRMQASSSDEVSTQLISAAVRQHQPYSTSGGVDAPVGVSGSVDSLSTGLRYQAVISSGSDEESTIGFEDKSESITSVYSKLMTDYRVNICLYNRDQEAHYRPKMPTPPVALRRSVQTSSSSPTTRVASTPPHSPARVNNSSSSNNMTSGSMTDIHARLLHPRPAAIRSASMDNLDMTDAASMSSSCHNSTTATKPNTMWDIAQRRNHEETPKLSFGEIIGLKEVKSHLEAMLVPFVDPRKKLLFSVGQQSQPERTLFIRSEKGSGIHTLVNATCKKSGVNLIRVNYGAENEWENRFFTKLLDFALAIQPVVVFFDRCDAWFLEKGEGWRHRGDKFILALEGNASIANGRADVMFVVSASEYLPSMHPRFSQWIKPYRVAKHTGFTEIEAQQCLYQALTMHINEVQTKIQDQHAINMLEYGGLVDAARGENEQLQKIVKECEIKRLQAKDLSAKVGVRFKDWTPAMIALVVNRAIDMARTRELGKSETNTYYDIINLVPTTHDITAVINSIQKTEPGTIVWKPN